MINFEINYNAYVKTIELSNDRIIFLYHIGKMFEVPANVIQDAEDLLYTQFQSVDRNRYSHENTYERTIASLLVASEKHKFKLDLNSLDAFIIKVFSNQSEYESTVSGIKYYQTELTN